MGKSCSNSRCKNGKIVWFDAIYGKIVLPCIDCKDLIKSYKKIAELRS